MRPAPILQRPRKKGAAVPATASTCPQQRKGSKSLAPASSAPSGFRGSCPVTALSRVPGPRDSARKGEERGEAAPLRPAAAPPGLIHPEVAHALQVVAPVRGPVCRPAGVRPCQQEALPWAEQRRRNSEPDPLRSLGRSPHPFFFPGTAVPLPDPWYGTPGCTLSPPPWGSFEIFGSSGALAAPTSILVSRGTPSKPGSVRAGPG